MWVPLGTVELAAMSTALPYMAPYVNDTTFDDNGVIQSVDHYELDRWWNPPGHLQQQAVPRDGKKAC